MNIHLIFSAAFGWIFFTLCSVGIVHYSTGRKLSISDCNQAKLWAPFFVLFVAFTYVIVTNEAVANYICK